MSNYSTLKAAISAVIKENNNHEITGQVLQTTLLAMVDSLAGGYLFKGIATPATVVGTPDENVFYIGGGGLYSNFGATPVNVPDGCIGIFTYNGTFENHIIPTGGVFDISAYNAVGGTPATYADLTAALGTNGANIPDYLRKGGMSVKFIQGTVQSSDNKYVQYRLTSDTFNIIPVNWQKQGAEVTVSQNSQTGHTDINIGSYSYSVASADEAEKLEYNVDGINDLYEFALTINTGLTIPLNRKLFASKKYILKMETASPLIINIRYIYSDGTNEAENIATNSDKIIIPSKDIEKLRFTSTNASISVELSIKADSKFDLIDKQFDLIDNQFKSLDSKFDIVEHRGGFYDKTLNDWYSDSEATTFIKTIMCQPNDVFYFQGYWGTRAVGALYYNSEGEIIGTLQTTDAFGLQNVILTIPSNVYQVSFLSCAFTPNVIPASFIIKRLSDIQNLKETTIEHVGFLNSSGVYETDSTIHCLVTPKIPCQENDIFYYRGLGRVRAVSYIFYNGTTLVSTGQIDNHNSKELHRIVTPSSCDSVVFTSMALSTDDIILDVYFESLADIANSINLQLDSPLVGKSINWLGDSYIANDTQPVSYTWHYKIAQKYRMVYRNYGINGNAITGGSGSMSSRYVDMDADADYVMVVGGTNDYNQQRSISDFKSQLRTFIENLVSMYPTSKIAFWGPWNNIGMSLLTIPLSDYAEAMAEVCNEYGMPYFNAFKQGGVFAWNSNVRYQLFQGSNDYAHLNEDGHNRFMSRAEAFLNEL